MPSRETLGFAAILVLLLSGVVLVDSWFLEDGFVDPDGEGPQAPAPNPEIVDQRAKGSRVELEIESALPVHPASEAPEPLVDLRPPGEIAVDPPRPKAIDPSGWLGRRHLRSPT